MSKQEASFTDAAYPLLVNRSCTKTENAMHVLIVDTSNEIAGDGDVPHPCVGLVRRLQVRHLADQCSVMIEGVQNHTPEVMVIEEIGRPEEVDAARTCKMRGVRMIASAHGDLRKLIKNKQLKGLVGGIEVVTLGARRGC
jgi:stage III sporulation protein SpoIIIAA